MGTSVSPCRQLRGLLSVCRAGVGPAEGAGAGEHVSHRRVAEAAGPAGERIGHARATKGAGAGERARVPGAYTRTIGLHSSTFQLNLSHFSHKIHPKHSMDPTIHPKHPLSSPQVHTLSLGNCLR
jgi:hypothetical protein